MDAFVPLLTGSGTVSIVQVKQSTTYHVTLDAPPSAGNKIFVLTNAQENVASIGLDVGGLTTIGATMKARTTPAAGAARLGYRDVQAGDPAGPYGSVAVSSNTQTTIIEVAGLPAGGPLNDVGADDQTDTSVEISITPDGGVDAWLVGGFGSFLYGAFGGTPTFTPNGDTTAVGLLKYHAAMWGHGQLFYGESDGSAVVLGGTQGGTTAGGTYRYGIRVAAFASTGGSLSWPAAPDTIDEAAGTSDDVTAESLGAADDVFWRTDLGTALSIGELVAVLGMESAGDVEILVQAGDASDWSDAATVITLNYTATGSLTADSVGVAWDAGTAHRYWQLVLNSAGQDVRVYEVGLVEEAEHVPTEPARAILEIYVHDEDASRWGIATWATGPATGTEGIWSAAGWQDVTPQGVNAHIIWGSREPDKGILARQNAASWNVETYDPDRYLDPANEASPYYPQIVAGVPIRISHESTVIQTGYIDRISYKYKEPDYRGQLLCTDTISLFNQAKVPEDSILGDTLHDRVWDAIEAAGIAVGGIPTGRPSAGPGPDIAPLDTGNPRERSVWDHITAATEEVLWVPSIASNAALGLRSWGAPLNRGREITAENLEDLESVSHEDGLYSVVRVQGDDPLVAPIEREAAPLPRYGRRVYERTELTVDPEGFADSVLQDRSWPGTRYSPGTIHCWTAADVDYFGSLQIMEYVTVTVPGVVSVQGRILGGELWVQHYRDNERGATWQFKFAVATEGSTAIGLTTLVSSQAGDTLLDSQTEADYLEAD